MAFQPTVRMELILQNGILERLNPTKEENEVRHETDRTNSSGSAAVDLRRQLPAHEGSVKSSKCSCSSKRSTRVTASQLAAFDQAHEVGTSVV